MVTLTTPDTTTGATLSRHRRYAGKGGSTRYTLTIPIPEGRLYTGPQGTGMEYEHWHRFSAWSDSEAEAHAQAYLARWTRKHGGR